MKSRLLYIYEERIPEKLRELVLGYIPKDEFEIDSFTYLASEEEMVRKLEWAEMVLFAPGRYLSDEVLSHAKHIKIMQLWSSGYDKFNLKACKELGIPVANNGGANACSVAEHAVLLMLSVYKWLPQNHTRTVTGNWGGNSHGLDMFLLHGKKIGIIGFGNIGKQVARKLSGFEPELYYYDIRRADPSVESDYEVVYKELDELLKESDIITLHLHANEKTKNIIGQREIDLMKKNAVIINVSRAQLIEQDAFYDALYRKRISGAGIDVYMKEPTDGSEPLLALPNIIATPHMAGSTYDTYSMVMERAVANFRSAKAGLELKWLI